jgi:hypothetical protein
VALTTSEPGCSPAEDRVGVSRLGCVVVFQRHLPADLLMKRAYRFQTWLAAVGHHDPRRPVRSVALLQQIPGDGDRRTARSQYQRLRAGTFPVSFRQESFQSQAAGDRVLGVSHEVVAVFGNAAQFAHQFGELVEAVELVTAGVQQIQFVRGDQRAERERVVLDKGDRAAIVLGLVVPGEVHPLDGNVTQLEELGPTREYLHDGGAVRRDAHEVHRGTFGGRVSIAGRQGRACSRFGHGVVSRVSMCQRSSSWSRRS